LTTKVINNLDEQPSTEDSKSAIETAGINENYEKALKSIRNNAEQIREIDQSLAVASHEVVDELVKVLQLNNRILRLANLEGMEVTVYPKGFAIIKDIDGNVEPKPLAELEPPFLYAVLKQLIPKLKESLDEKKHSNESLLEELTKTHESLV